MVDHLPSSIPFPTLNFSKSPKELQTSSSEEEFLTQLPEITSLVMGSESENEDEGQFLEEGKAHVHDEEYEEMRDLRNTWQKELEDVVDLEEYMTARMDDDDEAEEDNEVEVEREGRETILAWMGCDDEAEKEDPDEVLDEEDDKEGIWSIGNGEVEESAEVPHSFKIVQTIGKETSDFAAACHRTALNPAYPWVSGLNSTTTLTESQLTGTAWALDRLETVQGAILADAPGLGKKLTALGVILAQNNDRTMGKTLWGDSKPTLIVTSAERVETWLNTMKIQFDDAGYVVHPSNSTLNEKHLSKDMINEHVQAMKAAQKDPAMLIYVVDGDLILGCPDLSNCFGLKIIDEPGSLQDQKTELWKAIRTIESPFTLILTSTPPSTKRGLSAHLELINPDSRWDQLGVPYHQNPFNINDDDARAVLRATKKAVNVHLGSGLEKEQNLQKIYELVMLRREEFEVEVSSSEGSHYEDFDNIEMLPSTTIMQSIEVVEKVLNAALDFSDVPNPRKRQADEEAALPRGKRVRRDQSANFQQHISLEERDVMMPLAEPVGIVSSVWRYFQFWR